MVMNANLTLAKNTLLSPGGLDESALERLFGSLLGPGIVVPLVEGRLTLGTWQQIILIDFDTRPRDRKIVLQFMGQ